MATIRVVVIEPLLQPLVKFEAVFRRIQVNVRVCDIKCVNGHSFLSCKKENDYGQKEKTDSHQPEGAD